MKKKIIVFIIIVGVILFVYIFTKSSDKYLKAIKYAVEENGEFVRIDYKVIEKENTIHYYLYEKHSIKDYNMISTRLREYIKQHNDDTIFKNRKIIISFPDIHSETTSFAITNCENTGKLHDYFDIILVGSRADGFFFDINENLRLTGYKRLEIEQGYSLNDVEWILIHCPDVEVCTCYLNDNDFEALLEFSCKILPDCIISNMFNQ